MRNIAPCRRDWRHFHSQSSWPSKNKTTQQWHIYKYSCLFSGLENNIRSVYWQRMSSFGSGNHFGKMSLIYTFKVSKNARQPVKLIELYLSLRKSRNMGLKDGERVAEQGKGRESKTSDSPVYSIFIVFSKPIDQSSPSSLCFLMNSLICQWLVNIWFAQEHSLVLRYSVKVYDTYLIFFFCPPPPNLQVTYCFSVLSR